MLAGRGHGNFSLHDRFRFEQDLVSASDREGGDKSGAPRLTLESAEDLGESLGIRSLWPQKSRR